jgi:heme-degrading monooxygenase HmoA
VKGLHSKYSKDGLIVVACPLPERRQRRVHFLLQPKSDLNKPAGTTSNRPPLRRPTKKTEGDLPVVIARIWRGITPNSRSVEYLDYLKETGMRDYARIPGNLGASILVRHDEKETEFVIISLWRSMGEIKKFAGDEVEKARYYPKDHEFLLELEPSVKHYDLAYQL